jgi:glycosyltransferase 2 family protein
LTHDPGHDPGTKKQRIPSWIVPTVGYAIAIASLVFVFHQFDYKALGQDIRQLQWGWVFLGIVLNLAVYLLDAWRWQVLLAPAEEVPLVECGKAVMVGQVANAILPGKAGEVIRCYLLSHWTDTPLSLALTSDVIARVMDGICLVIGFYLVTIGVNVPKWLRDGALSLAIGVAVLSGIFLFMLFRREHATSLMSGRMSGRTWAVRFQQTMHEIHQLGDPRTLRMALGISMLYLLLPVLSVWCLFRAYAFDFTIVQAGVVLIIVHMGTMLPNAPANLGSFQFFATVALGMLNADRPEAKIFSLILYFAHTMPQIAIGALVLLLTGLKLGEVHMHARRAEHTHRPRCGPIEKPAVQE